MDIFWCARRGYLTETDLVDIDIFARSNDGSTLLHNAACSGKKHIVKMLLKLDSRLMWLTSDNKETALHYAAYSVSPSIKQLLSMKKSKDRFGTLPFFFLNNDQFLVDNHTDKEASLQTIFPLSLLI